MVCMTIVLQPEPIRYPLMDLLGARSAWMLEDYEEDQPGHKGNGKWTNDQLYSVLYEARRAGFQTWCHAIGDEATVSVWMYMNSF